MLYTPQKKTIKVMLTAFRDGLQSVFGGKVRTGDIIPALQAAGQAGIRHIEFGGGARYQAPLFYANENPFDSMDQMRDAAGKGCDLQILTRSVSGVTLTTQKLSALDLQARMMKKHGTTIDRNFDFMNDVGNLIKTGKPIIDAGMHHQVCIAMMGLPYASDRVHTPEFYIKVVRELLASGIRIDSVCMKDASGTVDPRTCYETALGVKKILPPEIPLVQHTHDTASMAVACYMAGIEGGVDGIDLSVRPLASGTSQPDVRSMWHALKGTGYALDIDHTKMEELEVLLEEGLKEYDFNPITLAADARVVNFPMPGGAIGPNVHMMAEAGILHKYGEVLAEFPEVVRAGGAWTSVTPGSQQYWLQAFSNVLHGRWKKIDSGYGRSVLGYFGRPPEPPDPEVIKAASEQLKLPPFEGDPLAEAPDSVAIAENALKERNLAVTDENIFLVASAVVPGKNLDLNEGVKFLTGKGRINLPLKKKAEDKPTAGTASGLSLPMTTTCVVDDAGRARTFRITIEPPVGASPSAAAPAATAKQTPVFSPFDGKVELVEVSVKVGESVKKGQAVAYVEAMKAKHEVRCPHDGVVVVIHAAIGTEVTAAHPIMVIGG